MSDTITQQAGPAIRASDGERDQVVALLQRDFADGRLTQAELEERVGAALAELIQERVQWVAAHLRVRPATALRYLTDEAVRDLARMMAVTVADEAPGADVLASPAWPHGPLRMPGTDRPPEPSNLM